MMQKKTELYLSM